MSDSSCKKEKKMEILSVAKKIFAHYGFKKTSMDDIATDAGLAKTSLYYYFKSKDQLFKEVIEYEGDILLTKLKVEVDKQSVPQEKLKVYFITKMKHIRGLRSSYKVTRSILKEITSYSEEIRSTFIDVEKEIILEILNEGVSKGIFKISNPKLIALSIIVSMKGFDESYLLNPEDEKLIHDNYEILLDMSLNGIMKR